jgi:hypothetical protein
MSKEDYEYGYADGKKFAQDKMLELMNEVIESYKESWEVMPDEVMEEDDRYNGNQQQMQMNAIMFMRMWVLSGGHEDFDGNRVCLPW